MKIKHASRVTTVALVFFSLLAISCLLVARQSWIISGQAYEDRLQMLAHTDRLASASQRLTAAVRAYAATGERRHYDDFQHELSVNPTLNTGLTSDEQELLKRAQRNKETLISLSQQAVTAVEAGKKAEALGLVYSPEYAAAQASVSQTIAECRRKLELRLANNAAALAQRGERLDDVALITLLLNALSILAVLVLFYRKRVIDPLAQIDRSLKDLIARKPGAAIGHQDDTNEIGEVARSIEKYRLAVAEADRQRWVKTSLAEITDRLLNIEQPDELGTPLLSSLVPLVGGGCAAFHLFDPGDGHFHLAGGYGLDPARSGTAFVVGQGIAGQAAAERKILHLTDLPDHYMPIGSALGQARPRFLSAVPLFTEEAVLAVLEVAAFSAPSADHKTLLQEVAAAAAHKLEAMQRNQRTRQLLDQVQASEAQLLRINMLTDSALDLTKSGYWHVPLDGSGYYNSSERAARIFGDPPTPDHRYELAHWTRQVFAGDEEAARLTMAHFADAVAGTVPVYDSTYAYKRPVDGEVVWIHALGHVVKDADGKATDIFGVTQDISEFKRLERALIGARDQIHPTGTDLQAAGDSVEPDSAPPTIRLSGLRLLLVEDNEVNQMIAMALLEEVGARVDLAQHGGEAVQKVLNNPDYHLVLMDLQMPEMDGYQATAQIRADSRVADLPIIAMTASATPEERQRCLDAGMNDHIAKPIEPSLLWAALSRFYHPPPDLDRQNALARLGGDEALYEKLLRQFLELETTPDQIEEQLACGDWPAAERLAHTLKGVAGSLGASALQKSAAELEQALKAQISRPRLAAFRSTMSDVVTHVRATPPSTTPAPPLDSHQVMTEMDALLGSFDASAAELFDSHRDHFRSLLSADEFSALQAHIANFALCEARNTLRQAAAAKEIPLP